jgi:pyruvate formate-lyase activating enzyme-like uncharacterized protein
MEARDSWLNSLVNANKAKFAEYDIKWLNPYQADEFNQHRNKLTKGYSENWKFKETKPFYHHISQGCNLCGKGKWSCLFITGKCNANCFYCPASQENDEIPATQYFNFPEPEMYAAYINHFGFKGISFSGGEPLLYFERVLDYLETLREKCDPKLYIWLYTNGILGDEDKYKKLAAAGLNEIRFDIGATGFNLDKVKKAKGIIPVVTIEIPAVPEETEKIKQLLPEMAEAGVSNLNLHQLRLTLYNAPKLSKRNYTFIHAEQPIVLESELAALEILNFARDNQLEIGINYCSFHFKNRFQKAGFRKQMTGILAHPGDVVSENGFIRVADQSGIQYKKITLTDVSPEKNSFEEFKLENKSYFFKKETVLNKMNLSEEEMKEIEELLKQSPETIPGDPLLFKIWQLEYIEKGLREY